MIILEQRDQDRWLQTLLQFVRSKELLLAGERALVCCSGGLDSSVLLHLMGRAADLLDVDLEVVHVDHRTRGLSSTQEGVWIQVLCDRMGLKLHRLSLPQPLKASGQLQLREARLKLIEELAEEKGFQKILTAHHADDNAETLFMRMISGSGVEGLKGISPSRGKWARPLLSFTRADIAEYAARYKLGWVEDPTNARSDYLRNRIRNEIFPKLEETRKSSIKNLSRLAERVEEEERGWAEWIQMELKQHPENTLPLGWLERWPMALQRRIVKYWLKNQGFENVPAWVEILLQKKDFLTPSGSFLFRSDSLLFSPEKEFGSLWSMGLGPLEMDRRYDLGFSRAWNFLPLQSEKEAFLNFSFLLQFRSPSLSAEGLTKLSWEALPWPLGLRTWQKNDPVDWIEQQLQSAGIPKPYWRSWPVLVGEKSQEFVGLLGVSYREKFHHRGLKRCVCIHPFFEHYLSPSSQS